MPRGIGAKHTACRRGEEVIVKLRNGETIIDIFVERKGNGVIILKNHGRVSKGQMRSFAVVRKPRYEFQRRIDSDEGRDQGEAR